MSEIGTMTGVKPKATYKTFERLRNSKNVYDNVDSVDKNDDNTVDNIEYHVGNVNKNSKTLQYGLCTSDR